VLADIGRDLGVGVKKNSRSVLWIPGYSIYQRPHKPQRIEIAGEFLATCMPLWCVIVFVLSQSCNAVRYL